MSRQKSETSSYTITQEVRRQRLLAGNLKLPDDPQGKGLPSFIIKVATLGASVDTNDPEAMLGAFLKYLKLCEVYNAPVGNISAYAAMGISKDDASRYLSGARRGDDPRYKELISLVKNICASSREVNMATGKINPAVGIFWQKNFDGMKDIQDIQVNGADPLGEKKDPQEIISKHLDLLTDEV